MNAPADCRRCGVCCFSRAEAYVRVTGEDWARLGEQAEAMAHFIGNRAFMRMAGGHCAALEVRRDADGAADYFCGIYERRPQVCRDLARGSPECAGERETKAEGPGQCGVLVRG
ncbi:MAG TPA: YkgJ family cysteine cluster protein [Opitutus sp.]|nr:YkgJ family cysteine cluster protein [Opitutus sp.]